MQRRSFMRMLAGGMFALAVWGQQAVASPMWDITSKTQLPAPDGTADTRPDVGVTETVTLSITNAPTNSGDARWSVVATGEEIASGDGSSFTFTAGNSAQTVVIVCTIGGIPKSKEFTVHAPEGIIGKKTKDELGYPAQNQGAGMTCDVVVLPKNCCFLGLKVKEDISVVPDVYTGHFVTHPYPHVPNPNPAIVTAQNKCGVNGDNASVSPPGLPKGQWLDGTVMWTIPYKWSIDGQNWNTITDVHQYFIFAAQPPMLPDPGYCQVRKYGTEESHRSAKP